MRPTVLIIEARREVAKALEAVITSANFTAVVVPHLERLTDLAITPAVIVVRIAFEGVSDPPHTAIERLPINRPPIVAIVWEEDELREAQRLKCDVVLHAPQDISRLCETLARLAET
jgi:hypothetical protein